MAHPDAETQWTLGRLGLASCAVICCVWIDGGAAGARGLTFEERLRAEEALARVYQSHRGAGGRPVPRPVLEARVRTRLQQDVALAEYWHTPITPSMLEREVARMVRDTRMPDRLAELFAALGGDPILVQECLARPALVERMVRRRFQSDPRIHEAARREAAALHAALEQGAIDPWAEHPRRTVVDEPRCPLLEVARSEQAGAGNVCPARGPRRALAPMEVGDIGPVIETSDSFVVRALLAEQTDRSTVAVFAVDKTGWDEWWAVNHSTFDADRVRRVAAAGQPLPRLPTADWSRRSIPPLDDTWDNGVLDDLPVGRVGHTAVWTGSEMIIWGGALLSDGIALNSGGRYDPTTDRWVPLPTSNAPAPRHDHTAVWTGTEMIVWGGGNYDTGARYDPQADAWTAVTTVGAPARRVGHDSFWTGSAMLVWGGGTLFSGGHTILNSGGLYDPQTNTWTPMSTAGAPRVVGHTAVWTGTEMIAWGGVDAVSLMDLETGSRYSPASDTWTPITTANAPAARNSHLAAWTGHEMLLWGGLSQFQPAEDGARYDPLTDRWSPMSAAGAPPPFREFAVWTGGEMIVWGPDEPGGRYDPAADRWTPTSTLHAPNTLANATVVWTGTEMIAWGGWWSPENFTNRGARYHPATDTWTPIWPDVPVASVATSAVWTGSELIVWGGWDFRKHLDTGSRYDPATDRWTALPTRAAPAPRDQHSAIWTGREMIVWGGAGAAGWVDTGGRYDPALDAWAPMSTVDAPAGRTRHTVVWTGREMVVWGGLASSQQLPYGTGGRYDPSADLWRPTSTDGIVGRAGHSAVWTGAEMLVWGGTSSGDALGTGYCYDPRADRWSAMSPGAPTELAGHGAVWTGREMLTWGGHSNSTISGTRYDPATGQWTSIPTPDWLSPRVRHSTIWSGREMIVWGGHPPQSPVDFLHDGGRYDPTTDAWTPTSIVDAPAPRAGASAIWTGLEMLVWGGQTGLFAHANDGGRYVAGDAIDDDGDGLSEWDGDCNDGAVSVFPGAVELCDGLDQDCNGAADDGDVDGDGHVVCEDCDDDNAAAQASPAEVTDLRVETDGLSWAPVAPVHGGTVVYDVARGAVRDLPAAGRASPICLAYGLALPSVADTDVPAPGAGYWYLARAREACAGSWGSSTVDACAGGARGLAGVGMTTSSRSLSGAATVRRPSPVR